MAASGAAARGVLHGSCDLLPLLPASKARRGPHVRRLIAFPSPTAGAVVHSRPAAENPRGAGTSPRRTKRHGTLPESDRRHVPAAGECIGSPAMPRPLQFWSLLRMGLMRESLRVEQAPHPKKSRTLDADRLPRSPSAPAPFPRAPTPMDNAKARLPAPLRHSLSTGPAAQAAVSTSTSSASSSARTVMLCSPVMAAPSRASSSTPFTSTLPVLGTR